MKKATTELKRITIAFAAALLLVGGVTGCKNTMEGARDDVEEIGDEIEEATD